MSHRVWGFVCVCVVFAVSGFGYVTDNTVRTAPNYLTFQPPAAGGAYADPVFGTSIKRISSARTTTNADAGGLLQYIAGEYSSMTPFNADNSKLLLQHQSYYGLYDGAGNFIRNLPMEINTSSEPRWSRSNPNVVYYLRANALKQYDASTGVISTVRAFTEYSAVSGRGESDICFDGNHFVLVGDNRYVFVYDIGAGTKGAAFDTGGRGFDSVYITPNDNVTITWLQAGSSRYNGIELFDRNMVFQRQLARAGGHMDVGRDSTGAEVLVWTNSNDPAPVCDNGIVRIRLSDGQQTCLLTLDLSLAVHISATDNSGWVFVETYAPADPTATSGWRAYTNEVLQIKLDGTETRRLAHHRSRPLNSYNYMPRVSASRDGSRIVYTSNYSLQTILGYPTEYSDVYLIETGTAGSTSTGGTTGGTTGTTTETTTRSEQTSAAITYTGTWFTNVNSFHSGGASALAMDAGSRASFAFNGTGVKWIAYRDEWAGIANVYLDGVLKTSVDTYAMPPQVQAVMYTITGLPAGAHTLVIEATGARNTLSGGSWVWIDALDVISGTSTTSTGGTTTAAATVRLEQNDPAVAYAGTWSASATAPHSGGSATASLNRGARVTLTFTGTAVKWIGYSDPYAGTARVYLDGQNMGNIDTYAPTAQAQQVLFSRSGLAAGTHTLVIEVTGRRSKASSASWVWVDAFDITR
jgi:hypothetical protein